VPQIKYTTVGVTVGRKLPAPHLEDPDVGDLIPRFVHTAEVLKKFVKI